ncbi:hypothetical protein Fmac_016032 [Flemingia macrophylla]|uniref:Secreted protein n=1 Tax=Flemingia macrophylla TaxID=520843 RepID=A0ABD1MGE4_9FABA
MQLLLSSPSSPLSASLSLSFVAPIDLRICTRELDLSPIVITSQLLTSTTASSARKLGSESGALDLLPLGPTSNLRYPICHL